MAPTQPTFFECILTRHQYCSDFLNFSTRCFPRFSLKTMSTWSPNDSFGFCSSRELQNTPYMLNLMKFWLRYLRLKTINTRLKARLHFCRRNKSCDEIKFWSGILIIKYLSQNFIKLSMLGMFWNPHDKQISKLSLGFKFDEDFT